MEGIEFPNMTTSKGSNAAAGDSSVGIGHSEVQGQEGRKRALIVSISSYNTLRRLEFCQKDGEEMYKLLEVLGYEISDNNKLIGEVKSETMRNAIMKFFTDRSIKSKD